MTAQPLPPPTSASAPADPSHAFFLGTLRDAASQRAQEHLAAVPSGASPDRWELASRPASPAAAAARPWQALPSQQSLASTRTASWADSQSASVPPCDAFWWRYRETRHAPIYVLTGGPEASKARIALALEEGLRAEGYFVSLVEATMPTLQLAGLQPDSFLRPAGEGPDLPTACLLKMAADELCSLRIAEARAAQPGGLGKSLVLCQGGLLSAWASPCFAPAADALCEAYGLAPQTLSRAYDGVVHLRSLAKDCPERFLRSQRCSGREAQRRRRAALDEDEGILRCWTELPLHEISGPNLGIKIRRALQATLGMLAPAAGLDEVLSATSPCVSDSGTDPDAC